MIATRRLTKVFHPRGRGGGSRPSRGGSYEGSREIRAVDAVDLDVPKGAVFGLIGPSGAGKTTLVKLLSSLIIPTSGRATVNGYDSVSQGGNLRESIGLAVGGERSFYYRLTGQQNLEFFAALQGLSGAALRRRVLEVVERVGLAEQSDAPFRYYSSGMKRKLDLARALLADPPVLLLDEPTTAIDPVAARRIRGTVRDLRDEGRTILLVTHNLVEAEKLCDTIVVMNHGRLVASGSAASLRSLSSCRKVTVQLRGLDQANRLASCLAGLPSVGRLTARGSEIVFLLDDHERAVNRIIDALAGADCSIGTFSVEQPSLEDVFLELTGGPR
jgi:ABC-2 type transport system ATP-binding protein